MKKLLSSLLFVFLVWSLQAPPAQAQTKPKHALTAAQKKARTLDRLWEQSDEAFHKGDYPLAIRLHKAIVALDPHDVESYSDAAWLMWSMGNGDEAQQHINRGLAANPKNWKMWDAAGQQDDLQKYFSKAEDAFKHAVKFLPPKEDSQMLRRRLAHAAEDAGDLTTALQTWKKLVADFPKEAVNQNNLKRVQLKIQAPQPTKAGVTQA